MFRFSGIKLALQITSFLLFYIEIDSFIYHIVIYFILRFNILKSENQMKQNKKKKEKKKEIMLSWNGMEWTQHDNQE